MSAKIRLTEEAVRDWLIRAVAQLARVDPASVGPETSFEDLGLSSLAAVTLSGDLSEQFGIEVDALITWDHPTIGEVARAIAGKSADRSPSGA